ncbi:hypothetical protein [Azospirillum himalayense]
MARRMAHPVGCVVTGPHIDPRPASGKDADPWRAFGIIAETATIYLNSNH